jgi:hypothetical protein
VRTLDEHQIVAKSIHASTRTRVCKHSTYMYLYFWLFECWWIWISVAVVVMGRDRMLHGICCSSSNRGFYVTVHSSSRILLSTILSSINSWSMWSPRGWTFWEWLLRIPDLGYLITDLYLSAFLHTSPKNKSLLQLWHLVVQNLRTSLTTRWANCICLPNCLGCDISTGRLRTPEFQFSLRYDLRA